MTESEIRYFPVVIKGRHTILEIEARNQNGHKADIVFRMRDIVDDTRTIIANDEEVIFFQDLDEFGIEKKLGELAEMLDEWRWES